MPEIQINNETLTFNNIIYVDTNNGDDSNGDGSENNPYRTFGTSYEVLSDGDALFVKNQLDIGSTESLPINLNKNVTIIGDYLKYNSEIYNDTDNNYGRLFDTISGYRTKFYNIKFTNLSKSYGEFFDGYQGNYTDKGNVELYNCIVESPNADRGLAIHLNELKIINSYLNVSSWESNGYQDHHEYINCSHINSLPMTGSATKTNCLQVTTNEVDSEYNITSSGWKNSGTGTNPDGTQANIGVYGGPYAWGQWIELYHLFNDNGDIKTYNTTNNIWNTLGTDTTEQQFLDNGLEDLNKLLEKDVTKSYTTTTSSSLGEGLEFEQEIDFSQFESIDSLEVQ